MYTEFFISKRGLKVTAAVLAVIIFALWWNRFGFLPALITDLLLAVTIAVIMNWNKIRFLSLLTFYYLRRKLINR